MTDNLPTGTRVYLDVMLLHALKQTDTDDKKKTFMLVEYIDATENCMFLFPERVLRATHQQPYQKGMQVITINDLQGELKHPHSYAITHFDYPGCPRTSRTSRTSRASRTSRTSRASRASRASRTSRTSRAHCRDNPHKQTFLRKTDVEELIVKCYI